MSDRIFYTACFGFILGVLSRSFIFIDLYIVYFVLFMAFIVGLFFISVSRDKSGLLISILLYMFAFGILRFNSVDKNPPESFEDMVGSKVVLKGEVVEPPTIGENNQKLVIFVDSQGLALDTIKARPFPATKILVSTSFGQDFKYGDEVNFSGKLQKPENFETDQGKVFDYVDYLRKDGVLYTMSYASIDIVSRGNGNLLKSILFSLKEKFLDKVGYAIPNPENLFMGGLILGDKASFSEELRQNFVNTGTIHIVALSGYNVTIVAEWFMKIFSFLSVNVSIAMGALAIVFFILMTGASSTAIRAGIMALLALVARATGRGYDVSRALIVALVSMVFFNPFILVYDVSFQLSFIATIAVIFFTPRIEKYFLWVTEKFGLRDVISVTTSAYIFVLPFILYKMGNLSLTALPTNVLILPFIPLTMILGFATGLSGFLWYGFSIPIGYISYLFLHYELGVIDFFASIPFSAITFPDFPLILTILIYIYFFYILFWRSVKNFLVE